MTFRPTIFGNQSSQTRMDCLDTFRKQTFQVIFDVSPNPMLLTLLLRNDHVKTTLLVKHGR